MQRIIVHIDMDAFYTSVEQRENPALKGKPVIVGADPKGGHGRGVVAACSYEARKYGIHSAQPISQAYRLCPQAVCLRPNFKLYEQVSEEVMGAVREFASKIEQVSVDEAFVDLSEVCSSFEDATKLVLRVKDAIKEKLGLTCSVGIASNKAVAKIASDFKKPDGLTLVKPEDASNFLSALPVTKIPGVGKKSSETLKGMGIKTIGELAATHPSRLREVFGKYGIRLWRVANGQDDQEVITTYDIKSISSESTFEEDVNDRKLIWETFHDLIQDVHRRTLDERIFFRTVGIKIRFEDFTTFTRARSLHRHTDEVGIIIHCVKGLLKEFEGSPKKIRLVGVRLSNLKKMGVGQETILDWAS